MHHNQLKVWSPLTVELSIILFQETLSKSEKTCSELAEKLRISEEEAKRDVELRIQVNDEAILHAR